MHNRIDKNYKWPLRGKARLFFIVTKSLNTCGLHVLSLIDWISFGVYPTICIRQDGRWFDSHRHNSKKDEN